jgi:hypothetical protein
MCCDMERAGFSLGRTPASERGRYKGDENRRGPGKPGPYKGSRQ